MIITCKRCRGTGKITKKVSMNITHYGTCPQCKGEGKWEILGLKENEEASKVQKIKVIRKLEELDGLENGMGLFMAFDTGSKTLCIVHNLKFLHTVDTDVKKSLIGILEMAKAMGFKFEYKPLRTKDEVLQDMERLACEKSDSCKTMVLWDKKDKKYYATDDVRTPLNVKAYFNDDIANDFANELNEIIRNS